MSALFDCHIEVVAPKCCFLRCLPFDELKPLKRHQHCHKLVFVALCKYLDNFNHSQHATIFFDLRLFLSFKFKMKFFRGAFQFTASVVMAFFMMMMAFNGFMRIFVRSARAATAWWFFKVPFRKSWKSLSALIIQNLLISFQKLINDLTGHGLKLGYGAGFTCVCPQWQTSPMGLKGFTEGAEVSYSLQMVLIKGFGWWNEWRIGAGVGLRWDFTFCLQLQTSFPSPRQLHGMKVDDI